MVWGGITATHRSDLVVIDGNLNAERYRDEVLIPVAIPFLEQHGPGIILQQDNARPHTARIVRTFMEEEHVTLLPWPAVSPDLSPIEHVWDEMERRVRALPQQPGNVGELRQALVNVWQDIPQVFLASLVNSMRRRCTAVINARGGHTAY